jgi:hypothetical protein
VTLVSRKAFTRNAAIEREASLFGQRQTWPHADANNHASAEGAERYEELFRRLADGMLRSQHPGNIVGYQIPWI